MDYEQFMTPYLAVDLDAFVRNIKKMTDFCRESGTNVRPHVKTHKCPEIARMLVDEGAIGVTCAKLGEAEAMVHGGIKDLLIANQVVGETKLLRLARLARLADVKVAVDNASNIKAISDAAVAKGSTLGVVIEVDVGMRRGGTRNFEQTLALVNLIKDLPGLEFRGLMGYEGHAVMIEDRAKRHEVCNEANGRLVLMADRLINEGHKVQIVSAGGTGSYDMAGTYPGVTEIEAGSYIFMDTKYATVGLPFEQSLFIVATVVSTPEPNLAILDTGLKTMTTEFGAPSPAYVVTQSQACDQLLLVQEDILRVKGVSEEHTKVVILKDGISLSIGDKVLLTPSHCCTTVNLYNEYKTFRSGKFQRIWPIEARGASY